MLLVCATYIWLFLAHIPFVVNRVFSASPTERLQQYTCFVNLKKVYDRVFVKSFGECCGSTVLLAACYWTSRHYIPAQKFVSVSGVKSQSFSVGVGLRQWCVLSPLLLFIVCIRVLQTTVRRTNPTCKAISPGCKTHFANNEKIYS